MSNSLQSQTHLGGSPNPHAQCDERIAALESEIANLRVVLESGKAAAIAVALFDLAGKIGHPPRFSSEHDLMTFIRDFAEQAERELAEIKQSGGCGE